MKWVFKSTLLFMLVLVLLGSTYPAYAQDGSANRDLNPGGRRVRGQVTAVSEASLAVTTVRGQDITVNVTADTRIGILGQGKASLEDIQVGDFIALLGSRQGNNAIQARLILVLPANPENLARGRGKIAAIEGEVIVVKNNWGERRVVTDSETKFRRGLVEISLADLNVDDPVFVLGLKQNVETITAKLVVVATEKQLRRHTLRGEVLSVDVGAGTLVVARNGDNERAWTVTTTSATRYRIQGLENPTLTDVPVGADVFVIGRPTDKDGRIGVARLIAVLPN